MKDTILFIVKALLTFFEFIVIIVSLIFLRFSLGDIINPPIGPGGCIGCPGSSLLWVYTEPFLWIGLIILMMWLMKIQWFNKKTGKRV